MWRAVQTVEIFKEDIDEDCFEDGTEPTWKKLKGAMKIQIARKVLERREVV